MTNFIMEMSKDLEEYETLELNDKKFYLKYIRLRVGLGVKGSVHLAKLAGDVAGAVFFTRDPKTSRNKRRIKKWTLQDPHTSRLNVGTETNENWVEKDYLDLKEELTPTTKRLAEVTETKVFPIATSHTSGHINPSTFNESKDSSTSGLFRIPRNKFKRGLRKSARIAKHMIGMFLQNKM